MKFKSFKIKKNKKKMYGVVYFSNLSFGTGSCSDRYEQQQNVKGRYAVSVNRVS